VKQERKMPGESKKNGPGNSTSSDNSVPSRRNILLAGTSLAAATAINAVDRTQVAQAQQPQQPSAPAGSKPNILMIMGDDIGWFNPSIYHRGIMG
jgi:arylsulfatase